MDYIEYLTKIACEHLADGSPLVLASIVNQKGSAPRHTGTKMVIGADGKGYGTIGGSLLEATAIKEGANSISHKRSSLLEFDLAGSGAESKGMICGGRATILLDYIAATQENREFFQNFNNAIVSGKDFYLATYLKGPDSDINVAGRSLLFSDGTIIGNSPLSASEREKLKSELYNISTTEIFPIDNTKVVIDLIQKLKTLYCFGAGHVAVPTAHIAALVGFRVVVLDDRAEFASTERFPDAFIVRIIEDFYHAFEGLDIDSDSLIVIFTRGHQFDQTVLEQALKTEAGYIGMISSKRKKEVIYKSIMAKGATAEKLAHIHSPIGIAIGAQTPEEIAVSIVAELISERQRMRM